MANEVGVTILPRTEDLEAWLVWLVPVIFLMLWDVWKAWKRRAFWIPGQALVLSGLIIQLLSFMDYKHISVYSGSGFQSEKVEVILVKNQLVIDGGRLMMCVLIAYFLPGMARSGSITDGSNLAALALSITFHVVSEVRSFWIVEKRNKLALSDVILSFLCKITLIAVIIFLLVLLIRATMIGRSIRRIMSQKIPSALSCTPCNDIKDHVLKCWIVARLSQPDYVLVRSGLRSWALAIVTPCIGVHLIKWIYVQFTDHESLNHESLNSVTKRTLVQFVIGGQFVIVLIGWIVLFVGWVTSRKHGDISSGDYFKRMGIEDALTDLTAYFIRLFVRDKRIQEKTIREMKIRGIISLLWYLWHWVQKLFQIFSKQNLLRWLTSPWHWVQKLFQIFSMQNLMRWLTSTKQRLSRIITRVIESFLIAVRDDGQFSIYKETLNMLLIPGESALSLWKANQRGFRKVKGYMEQRPECSPSELTDLLGTAEGEADREKAENLQQANKKSWKRTAVSLIHLMIYSYNDSDEDASVIEDAMQCYIQGWEYMNFVDGLNEEVKSLGRQADGEFDSLQHNWDNRAEPGMLETEIKQPLRQLTDRLRSFSDEQRRNLQNSRDWTEVANNCLFQTWTVIGPGLSVPHLLQRVLANVYSVYMTEGLNKAVLEKCSKLAKEGMEEEILDVAILLAKAQGVLDKVRERNDAENPVEPRHNIDEASTSSTVPYRLNEQDIKKWVKERLRRRIRQHQSAPSRIE